MKTFDVVVIGGGSAGYAAARTAAAAGAKVAVVEGGKDVGGLCILRGCMPTKALLEAAHRHHAILRAGEFGLKVGRPTVDWKKVVARKDRHIADFASYREQQLWKGRFEFIRGYASFEDPHTLLVTPLGKVAGKGGKARIRARSVIVATGSVVDLKGIPGLAETGFITSDGAIRVTKPLKDLIILGGGAIAVEFAQYFQHMGVKVTLIQRSGQILKGHDPDVAAVVEKVFVRDGMRVFTDTELRLVKKTRGRKVVEFLHQGRAKRVEAEEILYALGRKPAVDGLAVEAGGLELRKGYIATNLAMQSSQPHIFAVGDVSGPYEVVHTAITQGELAARNALRVLKGDKSLEKMDYRLQMEIIFTEPEVAGIGMNEKRAKELGVPYLTASYPFDDHGKSLVMGETDGFVKLIAEPKKGRLLGAQIVGPHASDLIHEFVAVMYFNGTVKDVAAMPHYHPTLAEIVTYPAEEIEDQIG